MTNVLIAGLAAAAAIQPGIATNPEAPNAIPVLTVAELNTLIDKLSVAVAAAIAGVTAGVNGFGGLTPEEAASIAAPAAMAAIASAAGVPQPGCHRHPHQCGTNVCRLTMHYAP